MVSEAGEGAAGNAGDGKRCCGRVPRRLAVLLMVLAVAMLARFVSYCHVMPAPRRIERPLFLEELKAGEIEEVLADGREYYGRYVPGREPERFVTQGPTLDSEPGLRDLMEKHVTLVVERQ